MGYSTSGFVIMAFNLVCKAVSTDLPSGNVKLAMEKSDDNPKTIATAQVLLCQFIISGCKINRIRENEIH